MLKGEFKKDRIKRFAYFLHAESDEMFSGLKCAKQALSNELSASDNETFGVGRFENERGDPF